MAHYYICPLCGYNKAEYVKEEGQVVCFDCGHRFSMNKWRVSVGERKRVVEASTLWDAIRKVTAEFEREDPSLDHVEISAEKWW